MALSRFIEVDALVHCRTTVKSSSVSGRTISSWSMAVAYLLKRYATNHATCEAVQDLRAESQRPAGTEEQCYSRFVQQQARAGCPFGMNERIAYFINGLDPRLRPVVDLERESEANASNLLDLQDIAVLANIEGETLRARSAPRNPASKAIKTEITRKGTRAGRSVTYADDVYGNTHNKNLFQNGIPRDCAR